MSDTSNLPAPVSAPAAPLPPAGWKYAGFGARSMAFAIDQFLLFVIIVVLALPATIILGVMQMYTWPFGALVVMPTAPLATVLIAWVYFAPQESSRHQATFGKRLCGLQVVDLEGRRLTLAHATGRFLAKFLSAMIMMVGFLMAAFTERHQALHDMLAETLVVKKAQK